MRLATFNLENLDLPPRAPVPLDARAQVLRPALERLDADILCLQEVNGQHVSGQRERTLAALDQLLAGSRYAAFERRVTSGPHGGVADVHNLVTLSRYPIRASEELRHRLVPPPLHAQIAGAEPGTSVAPQPVRFDRPVLVTEIALPDGYALHVFNVHLRAPIASALPGQKLNAHTWRSTGAWAEGYYLSDVRRVAQALEVRLAVDEILGRDPAANIVVCGDFNAEDRETPLEVLIATEEDTGNAALSAQALVMLDRSIPADRRFSVLHHGRPQMLDHVLASRAVTAHLRTAEVHNEALGDEAIGFSRHVEAAGSYHAALVVTLGFPFDSD